MSDANIQELRFEDFAESGYWGQQIPRPEKKSWTKKMWKDLITECEKITGENLQYILENNELEDFEELFEI